MKVLWFTNIEFPEVSKILNTKVSVLGGWMISASNYLSQVEGIELYIASPKVHLNKLKKIEGNKITYYLFNSANDLECLNKKSKLQIESIISDVRPDLVHIHGTELPHSEIISKVCNKRGLKTVVSLQGVLYGIKNHVTNNIPVNILYGSTIRNFLKKDNIIQLKNLYNKRSKSEKKCIQNTENIIGRTNFDKFCSIQIKQDITYYHCNEVLRESFYKYEWDIESCEKYSIFLSQGHYSIKGLHNAIEAIAIVKKRFKHVKLYIGGNNILDESSVKAKFIMTKYSKYIRYLIKKYNLEKNIEFTGSLSEEKMCKMYLKTNIFICTSSVENSPNSLCEAMILGVPTVASYVGGIPDMIEHKKNGLLYQHDAPYMLAGYIQEIFLNYDTLKDIFIEGRKTALKRHDLNENNKVLLEIYKKIVDK